MSQITLLFLFQELKIVAPKHHVFKLSCKNGQDIFIEAISEMFIDSSILYIIFE